MNRRDKRAGLDGEPVAGGSHMYAVFETGGKQYKVSAGDVIRIEKIRGNEGDAVKFENVLAFSDENGLKLGTPYLEAAVVNATITAVGRGDKVIIFKYLAKKDSRKKRGHRQPYTEIEVDDFLIDGKKLGEKPIKPKAEEEAEEAEETEEIADEKPVKAKRSAKPKKEKTPKTEEAEEDVTAGEAEAEKGAVEPEEEAEKGAVEPEAEAEKPAAEAEEKPKKPAKPKKEKAPKAEKAEDDKKAGEAAEEEVKAEETPAEKAEAPAKEKAMTKADIMAKLDELGLAYSKSAKKDELNAILENSKK